MIEYYQYLWKATWIENLSIILLGLFIITRSIWKVYAKVQKGIKLTDKLLLTLRGLGWLIVFSAYLLIFHESEPDWFARPVQIQGEIISKGVSQNDLHPYSVEIGSESGKETLFLDHFTYYELRKGQRVNVSYLPHRLEVFTCEILPPLGEKNQENGTESKLN